MSEHGPLEPTRGTYRDSPAGRGRVEALVALSGAINQLEQAVAAAPTDVERGRLQAVLDEALRAYRSNTRAQADAMDAWDRLAEGSAGSPHS